MISILWCARFDDDNEPDDYHDEQYCEQHPGVASCLDLNVNVNRKKKMRQSELTTKTELWEEAVLLQSEGVLQLSPETGPRPRGRAVIGWQHMSLLRVHNLDAYM